MIFGSLGVELELLAQPADLRVDAAVERLAAERPRARSSSWSRLSTRCGRSTKAIKQIVFAGAERHRDAIIAKQLARSGVEPPAIEMITLGSRCRARR